MKKGIRLMQGLLLSYIITGILLMILAFLLYQMEWGEKISHIGIIFTYILSTVIGGFYVGKKVKSKRLIFGFLFGLLYIGIILAVSLLLYPKTEIFSGNMVTVCLMCIGGGILGGILS
ncbi:MAG: TIGR04086 family membrane protein [Lachnospiraceae bacterium]|nr:TIGR04086 family membrane protein [Lachnospiraceae bacterium]